MRLLAFALMLLGLMFASTGAWAWLPFVSTDMRLDLVGVILFVVLGASLYFAGSWLYSKAPPERTKTFVLQPNDIGFITNALQKERRRLVAFGVFLLAFAAVSIFAATHGNEGDDRPIPIFMWPIFAACVLLPVGLGLAALHKSFKLRNTEASRIYGALVKTPHLISSINVYRFQQEHAPGKLGQQILIEVSIGTDRLRMMVSEEHLSLLTQHIQLHSPQASYREEDRKV